MYVIDNSNFCYKFRSVHRYSKVLVEGVLLDTSVLTGYIKSLRANIFNNIVIVLDGVPLRSKAILPNYKGTRLNSENINLGIPKLEVIKFLTAVGPLLGKTINVVIAPGQEADQVISSIAHLAQYDKIPEDYQFLNSISYLPLDADKVLKYLNVPELDMEPYYPIKENVIIATTDSDMAQLQRFSNVYIDTSTSGKAVTDTRTAKAVQSLNPYAIPYLQVNLWGCV